MTLKQARIRFSFLLSEKLLPFIRLSGYEYAYDEITNHQGTGHKKNSVHYDGCAGDIIIYKDGNYLTKTEDYKFAGDYWVSLDPDCVWGGEWEDGNHFSFVPKEIFQGRK